MDLSCAILGGFPGEVTLDLCLSIHRGSGVGWLSGVEPPKQRDVSGL